MTEAAEEHAGYQCRPIAVCYPSRACADAPDSTLEEPRRLSEPRGSSFYQRIECREDHLISEISRDTEEQQRVRTGGGHQEPAFLVVVFFPELMPGYPPIR